MHGGLFLSDRRLYRDVIKADSLSAAVACDEAYW